MCVYVCMESMILRLKPLSSQLPYPSSSPHPSRRTSGTIAPPAYPARGGPGAGLLPDTAEQQDGSM